MFYSINWGRKEEWIRIHEASFENKRAVTTRFLIFCWYEQKMRGLNLNDGDFCGFGFGEDVSSPRDETSLSFPKVHKLHISTCDARYCFSSSTSCACSPSSLSPSFLLLHVLNKSMKGFSILLPSQRCEHLGIQESFPTVTHYEIYPAQCLIGKDK